MITKIVLLMAVLAAYQAGNPYQAHPREDFYAQLDRAMDGPVLSQKPFGRFGEADAIRR